MTCSLDGEHGEAGVCQSCVSRCHAGHLVFQSGMHARACCDCIAGPAPCKCLAPNSDAVALADLSSLTDREDYDILM